MFPYSCTAHYLIVTVTCSDNWFKPKACRFALHAPLGHHAVTQRSCAIIYPSVAVWLIIKIYRL